MVPKFALQRAAIAFGSMGSGKSCAYVSANGFAPLSPVPPRNHIATLLDARRYLWYLRRWCRADGPIPQRNIERTSTILCGSWPRTPDRSLPYPRPPRCPRPVSISISWTKVSMLAFRVL